MPMTCAWGVAWLISMRAKGVACSGEACIEPLASAPVPGIAGSSNFTGPANPRPARHHKKKHKRKKHAKHRHAKKGAHGGGKSKGQAKKSTHRRAAKTKGRAGR